MSIASQIFAVTVFNLRNVPRRCGNSLVIVVGIAGVVLVLTSVLAMSAGLRAVIEGSARADRAIVLSRGAESESASAITRETLAQVQAAAAVKKDASGKPIVSAEVVLVAPVSRKRGGADAYITLRGVSEQAAKLRPELMLVAGRMFEAGVHELIVGKAAQSQFEGLAIGSRLRLYDGDWTVVGVFAGGDNVRESEVMAGAQTVLSAYKLDTFNSVAVRLVDERSLAAFEDALGRIPSLDVDVRAEPEYLADVSGSINRLLQVVAYAIGAIMAVGALFAALNTMYSAVSSRMREIATLRAIGFGSSAILSAIVIESLLLSLTGAAIGISIAYLAFNGQAISTLGGARWDTQLVYSISITPSLVAIASGLACTIGLIGGLFPALRAVRISVAESLRAT